MVGTDPFHLDNEIDLVTVDYFTKWIKAVKIPGKTATVVISTLKCVFARLWVPRTIKSDNGLCYDCREFLELAKAYGFNSVVSTPRYPESNKLADCVVRMVKHLWKRSTDRDAYLMAHMVTPLALGKLMFSRTVWTSLDKPVDSIVNYNNFENRDLEQKTIIES